MIPRVCSVCEHFYLSTGEQGYSDMTPGSDASIECQAFDSAWPKDRYPDVEFSDLMKIAANCPKFAPHHDLPTEAE